MIISSGIFIAMIFVLVGRILKPKKKFLTWSEKQARIKVDGHVRRICSHHMIELPIGAMAILDNECCDICIKEN